MKPTFKLLLAALALPYSQLRSQNLIDTVINSTDNLSTVSTGGGNNALNYMATVLWQSSRHSTTEQAVNNLLARQAIPNGRNIINIAGHGKPGMIETGGGQYGPFDHRTNYIAGGLQYFWGPYLSKIKTKQFPMIYLWGCDVGAGEAGAELLYEIAFITGHPVAGRTGATGCNGQRMFYEVGSVWQVATSDHKPNPIAPPHLYTKETASKLQLFDGNIFIDVGKMKIKNITLEQIDTINTPSKNIKPVTKRINAKKTKNLIYPERFTFNGELLAIKTHVITIEVKSKTKTKYNFSVFNSRIIRDDYGNYYYLTKKGIDFLVQ